MSDHGWRRVSEGEPDEGRLCVVITYRNTLVMCNYDGMFRDHDNPDRWMPHGMAVWWRYWEVPFPEEVGDDSASPAS
ncbi:MAG: hypothetical protein WC683_08230 [bacterium]